jgi:phosphocarrier protein FPr
VQFKADFGSEQIQYQFPASDMTQMSAVAAGLIKNSGGANDELVAELVSKAPTHLGKGLWLASGSAGVSRTVMSYVSAGKEFEHQGQPVKALIAFAACNAAHKELLNTLTQLVYQQRQQAIAEATPQELLNMFTGEGAEESTAEDDDNVAVFKIKNAHGLHARPGAMLVAEAKKFESSIKVANLNGDAKPVNAKSLMKVIAMGVKKGHELRFVADGADAPQALQAIGSAIEAGLGEG